MKATIDDLPPPAQDHASNACGGLSPKAVWWIALFILIAAIAVRVYPSAGFTGAGFDEALYRDYVIKLDKVGLTAFPEICALYLEDQRKPETITKLPPTRFLYIFTAWAWKRTEFGDTAAVPPRTPGWVDHDPALVSLHRVACLFSVLGVIAAGLAAWRMLGVASMLGVLALTGFAPVSIHMGQHALIDGVFAFWATMNLWLLWENLRHPGDLRRLLGFGACLACMVLTKENSFFVYVALCGLVAVNRWTKVGTVTPDSSSLGSRGLRWARCCWYRSRAAWAHFSKSTRSS